ncbi:ribosome-binding factor A [candidate division KSB1 bacterium RBG_16_48_16]|nr:MAG: ribosome-binding factor A [candidate division KSB1 bacterium RBG_16_48_16]
MQHNRAERIAAQIKAEVGQILLTKAREPYLSYVTVTRVSVSKDLKYSKIFYSVLGEDDKIQKAGIGLQRALKYIRSELSKALRIRLMPEIQFIYDDSVAYADRIQHLINDIHREEQEKPNGGD